MAKYVLSVLDSSPEKPLTRQVSKSSFANVHQFHFSSNSGEPKVQFQDRTGHLLATYLWSSFAHSYEEAEGRAEVKKTMALYATTGGKSFLVVGFDHDQGTDTYTLSLINSEGEARQVSSDDIIARNTPEVAQVYGKVFHGGANGKEGNAGGTCCIVC